MNRQSNLWLMRNNVPGMSCRARQKLPGHAAELAERDHGRMIPIMGAGFRIVKKRPGPAIFAKISATYAVWQGNCFPLDAIPAFGMVRRTKSGANLCLQREQYYG